MVTYFMVYQGEKERVVYESSTQYRVVELRPNKKNAVRDHLRFLDRLEQSINKEAK